MVNSSKSLVTLCLAGFLTSFIFPAKSYAQNTRSNWIRLAPYISTSNPPSTSDYITQLSYDKASVKRVNTDSRIITLQILEDQYERYNEKLASKYGYSVNRSLVINFDSDDDFHLATRKKITYVLNCRSAEYAEYRTETYNFIKPGDSLVSAVRAYNSNRSNPIRSSYAQRRFASLIPRNPSFDIFNTNPLAEDTRSPLWIQYRIGDNFDKIANQECPNISSLPSTMIGVTSPSRPYPDPSVPNIPGIQPSYMHPGSWVICPPGTSPSPIFNGRCI